MTYETIIAQLKKVGLPTAYDHFVGEQAAPCCIVTDASANDFVADNAHHKQIYNCAVELYTDKKDMPAEAKVKDALKALGVQYAHDSETYITSQKEYMNRWNVEFIGD